MQTSGNDREGDAARTDNDAGSMTRTCFACGADGNRGKARFCMMCGQELEDLTYLPAASLRATYHAPGQPAIHKLKSESSVRRLIFTKTSSANRNGASSTAMAFVTYALVPYLGILFCPGAVLMGGIGLVRQWRVPNLGGRNAACAGVVFGIVIFSAQVFLWWILYKVPQWATGVEF